MSQELKKVLLQDLQNIETLRQGAKLTEKEHILMKAAVARLLKLVNDSYPDQPALPGAKTHETSGLGPNGPGDELG